MSFQEYFKYIITHYLTQKNQPVQNNKEKENNQRGISNTWFGLFPFSFKLLFRKEKQLNSYD